MESHVLESVMCCVIGSPAVKNRSRRVTEQGSCRLAWVRAEMDMRGERSGQVFFCRRSMLSLIVG